MGGMLYFFASYLYFSTSKANDMTTMQLTNAKLIGALESYFHNGVRIVNHGNNVGAHDLSCGNTPKPYIDVNLAGGIGVYVVLAVIDGVIREMATCGPDVTNLTPTAWAAHNGWIASQAEKRLIYIL
mgnify:FL=1